MIGDLIRQLRKAKGLTQAQVAEAIGVKPSAVTQWEGGGGIETSNLTALAKLFAVPIDALLEDRPELVTNVRLAKDEIPDYRSFPKDLPVWFTAEAGEGAFTMDMGNAVDTVRRPSGLANNKNAYAIYVEGNCMEPIYEAGDLLYVDPNRRPRNGRDCVVVLRERGEGEGRRYLLKRLLKRTPTKWVFRQFNPDREVSLDEAAVEAVHLVLKNHEVNV